MTQPTIVAYEMVTELLNQRGSYNDKAKSARKNSFGRITNGYLYHNNEGDGGWMVVNPLQTRSKCDDTPIFAVYSDGSKVKISSHHFFSMFCDEAWVSVKCSDFKIINQGGDSLSASWEVSDEMWNEEREDRPTAIVWSIPARTKEEFTSSLQKGSLKTLKSGKTIREFSFEGTTKFVYGRVNLRPIRVKRWPLEVMTEEEYNLENPFEDTKPSVKAAKSAVSAPILADELAKFEEECEVVEVPAEAANVDEVNALFGEPTDPSALMW